MKRNMTFYKTMEAQRQQNHAPCLILLGLHAMITVTESLFFFHTVLHDLDCDVASVRRTGTLRFRNSTCGVKADYRHQGVLVTATVVIDIILNRKTAIRLVIAIVTKPPKESEGNQAMLALYPRERQQA